MVAISYVSPIVPLSLTLHGADVRKVFDSSVGFLLKLDLIFCQTLLKASGCRS